jgi:hypothetical protein
MAIGTALAIGAAASAAASGIAGAVSGAQKEAAGEAGAQSIRAASGPDPAELKQLETNIQQQEQTLNRERELIKAVDPALAEAGKQAFQLLQGQEAKTLGPIKRNRARQREQLRETLRRQLGPGFETSSAGIEALSRFDMETGDITMKAQDQALGRLLSSAHATSQMGRQGEQFALNLGQANMQARQNIADRRLRGESAASQLKTSTAGSAAAGVSSAFGSLGKGLGFASQLDFGGGGPSLDDSSPASFTGQMDITGQGVLSGGGGPGSQGVETFGPSASLATRKTRKPLSGGGGGGGF